MQIERLGRCRGSVILSVLCMGCCRQGSSRSCGTCVCPGWVCVLVPLGFLVDFPVRSCWLRERGMLSCRWGRPCWVSTCLCRGGGLGTKGEGERLCVSLVPSVLGAGAALSGRPLLSPEEEALGFISLS